MRIHNMWGYAQDQKYTDVTVIEKLEYPPPNHTPREYPSHRLILSKCDYFKTQFESKFNDSTTPKIHVFGGHQYPGILGTILEAIYSEPDISKEIYENFIIDNSRNLDKCIAIYNVCGYLMLLKDMDYIEEQIKNVFNVNQMIEWWVDHPIKSTHVPLFIKGIIYQITREFLINIPTEITPGFLLMLENRETLTFFTDLVKERLPK